MKKTTAYVIIVLFLILGAAVYFLKDAPGDRLSFNESSAGDDSVEMIKFCKSQIQTQWSILYPFREIVDAKLMKACSFRELFTEKQLNACKKQLKSFKFPKPNTDVVLSTCFKRGTPTPTPTGTAGGSGGGRDGGPQDPLQSESPTPTFE